MDSVRPFPRTTTRFSLTRAQVASADFASDVRRGLSAGSKSLPPRWFYDELGSALFDTICFLPEYYVMRSEGEVLTNHAPDIASAIGSPPRLVELGSGAARKTRILLDRMTARQLHLEYVPIDIDAAMLTRVGRDLIAEYPHLEVHAVAGDITRPSVALSALPPPSGRTAVLFLGSTIGNFDPEEGVRLLRDLRNVLVPGDVLLLGADLRKPREILEPAYDDALGVTAAFNLNVLGRINRELGGNFDLEAFRHYAFYDEELGRIEMHLVSRRAQTVTIGALDLEIAFAEGETIHTENSWKHDDASLQRLALASGFAIDRTWKDAREYFADVLMVAV